MHPPTGSRRDPRAHRSTVPARRGSVPARRPVAGRRGWRAVVAALLVGGTVLASAGCGLRLETPPPAQLTPDADEAARQRATADAMGLQVLARSALPGADPASAVVLEQVADFSAQHAARLGGPYVSGLPTPSATPGDDGTDDSVAEPAPSGVELETVVARLEETAASARADAAAVPDGNLARLLASISTARLLSSRQLVALAGETSADLPPSGPWEAVPEGVDSGDAATVTTVEDQAGYAFEVIAAKLSGRAQTAARSRGALHRDRAQQWAVASGTVGTTSDPRRTSYALPPGLDDPAVAVGLAQHTETAVAAAYADVVSWTAAGARSAGVDALAEVWITAVAWGAAPVAFPGMPDQAG